jgi:predicted Abi (CAAX) family protease
MTVWLCVTLAGTVRIKAIAHEFLFQQHRHTLPRPPANQLASMRKMQTGTWQSYFGLLRSDSLDRRFWSPLGTWLGRVVANDRS